MFDEKYFFTQAKITKSSEKRVKIIYLFCSLHTLKCKEKHPPVGRGLRPSARGARASPAPVGGGSEAARQSSTRPRPPVGGGLQPHARAAHVPLAPSWQGGLQPRAREARASQAPGGRGDPAARQSGVGPRAPVGRGNSGCMQDQRA